MQWRRRGRAAGQEGAENTAHQRVWRTVKMISRRTTRGFMSLARMQKLSQQRGEEGEYNFWE